METRPPGANDSPEPSLKKMVVVSIFFHVLIFSLAFLLPQPYSSIRPIGEIIEVDLVEMPRHISTPKSKRAASKTKAKVPKKVIARKRLKTRRPGGLKVKEKSVVIAKKVVKKRRKKKKTTPQAEKLLEEALKKIEKRLEKKEVKPGPDRVEEAVSRLASKAKEAPPARGGLGPAAGGIAIEIYKAEVESRIKENWAYPVALVGPDATKALEATVVLTVKRSGEIIKWEFVKRSGNAIFDDSVIKAIERSNPLPPFPEGYIRSFDEVEINFNLQELQG